MRKSCRSRRELSNECSICVQNRLRYSRERASQSLPKVRNEVRMKIGSNDGIPVCAVCGKTCGGESAPEDEEDYYDEEEGPEQMEMM